MKKSLLITLMACLVLGGCGSAAKGTDSAAMAPATPAMGTVNTFGLEESTAVVDYEGLDEGFSYSEDGNADMAELTGTSGADNDSKEYGQKLIKTYNYSLETTDFAKSEELIRQTVIKYGGYIEDLTSSGYEPYRYAYYTIRIPENRVSEFLDETGNMGTVYSKSESQTDITTSYFDVAAHIEALETQHARLLQLMEQAEELEDIIALEERLSDIEYQLGSYKSTMKIYDNQVEYATVSMDLNEVNTVSALDNDSMSEKIAKGLSSTFTDMKNGFANFVIWFVVNLPYIVIWVVVIAIAFTMIRKIRRKHRGEKHEEGRRGNHRSILGKKRDGDCENADDLRDVSSEDLK